MKKILIGALCMSLCLSVFSQKVSPSQIPDPVLKTFRTKLADSLAAVWEKSGTVYLAAFTKNKLKGQISIAENGDWNYTRWEVPVEFIPNKIREYLKTNYPAFKIRSASIEYKPGGEFYLIGLQQKKELPVLRFTIKSEFVAVEPAEIKKK